MHDTEMVHGEHKRWLAPLFGLVLLLLAVWLGFKARNEARQYDYIGVPLTRNVITVSGEGKVIGIPDVANIDLGTSIQRNTVGAAQQENTRVMNELNAKLKEAGIDEKDIQTTQYNVYPVYDYNNGVQRVTGYTVSQSVHVKIRDLDKVGEIIGMAGGLGANQIGGITFSVDEPEVLKQQARVEALEQAKAKANALAQVAGVKLRRVVSFDETSSGGPMPPYYSRDIGMGGAENQAVPTIEPGSSEIIVNVTITYELQ